MKRRLITILRWGTLLLPLLVALCWARSGNHWDNLRWTYGRSTLTVNSAAGRVHLAYRHRRYPMPEPLSDEAKRALAFRFEYASMRLLRYAVQDPTRFGFRYEHTTGGAFSSAWTLQMRYWLLLALASAPPAWQAYRLLRNRRRAQSGRCPACGYDLRATPARCPECGLHANAARLPVPAAHESQRPPPARAA